MTRAKFIQPLILLLAFAFFGCGQQPNQQAATGKKLIVIITPPHDNPFFKAEADR